MFPLSILYGVFIEESLLCYGRSSTAGSAPVGSAPVRPQQKGSVLGCVRVKTMGFLPETPKKSLTQFALREQANCGSQLLMLPSLLSGTAYLISVIEFIYLSLFIYLFIFIYQSLRQDPVALAGLELTEIPLPLPSEYWDYTTLMECFSSSFLNI